MPSLFYWLVHSPKPPAPQPSTSRASTHVRRTPGFQWFLLAGLDLPETWSAQLQGVVVLAAMHLGQHVQGAGEAPHPGVSPSSPIWVSCIERRAGPHCPTTAFCVLPAATGARLWWDAVSGPEACTGWQGQDGSIKCRVGPWDKLPGAGRCILLADDDDRLLEWPTGLCWAVRMAVLHRRQDQALPPNASPMTAWSTDWGLGREQQRGLVPRKVLPVFPPPSPLLMLLPSWLDPSPSSVGACK